MRKMVLTVVLAAGCTMTMAEVPPAYLAPEWRLLDLNGERVTVPVTIDLAEPGRVTGQGPCNRYFGPYEGALPAFRPGAIASTQMACDALDLEVKFFAALQAVTQAVTEADRLILTGPGARLEFLRPIN